VDEFEEPREVDLHGLRPELALRRLRQELHAARIRGEIELLAITGRGWGNLEQKPVLRGKLEAWMATPEAKTAGVRRWEVVAKGGALLLFLG
jgi:DNA-nicking Smr family endonuclease